MRNVQEFARDIDAVPALLTYLKTFFSVAGRVQNSHLGILLATEEIFTNIVNHDSSGSTDPILVTVSVEGELCTICIASRGAPFNPNDHQEVQLEGGLDVRQPGGLGLFLVRMHVDEVEYCYENELNRITLIKRFASAGE